MEKKEFNSHISEKLNRNLEDLFNHILEMGGMVERQFESALQALGTSDVEKARQVIIFDKAVNQAEMDIDRLCARVLARQQPTASDLRLILAAIRIAIDLERMGDEIVKVAKLVITFDKASGVLCSDYTGYSELVDISTRSNQMLKTALDSFARVSIDGASELIREEESLDDVCAMALKKVKAALVGGEQEIDCLLEMSVALRAAERVSDHAKNIIESIIYLVLGQDMRNLDNERLELFLNSLDEQGD